MAVDVVNFDKLSFQMSVWLIIGESVVLDEGVCLEKRTCKYMLKNIDQAKCMLAFWGNSFSISLL